MDKNELQCGDIVSMRNGWEGIYMPNYAGIDSVFLNTQDDGYMKISRYNNNLECAAGDRNFDWDIIRVYRSSMLGSCPWSKNSNGFDVIWSRETEIGKLRSGDVAILRNGNQYVYMEKWGEEYIPTFLGLKGGWMDPNKYDSFTLKHANNEWDIVRIYRPVNHCVVPWVFSTDRQDFNLIWEAQ